MPEVANGATLVRDRIKSLRRVPAGKLLANPKNWRTHPKAQANAMRGVLEEIGFAGALLARETDEGLQLIDGHLRKDEVDPAQKIPVLILDVTEDEADKILATFDPLSAMAGISEEQLGKLLSSVSFDDVATQAMLDDLLPPVVPDIEEDEVPEVPADPIAQAGDIWICGDHKVICGDSTDAATVERLMGGERAGLCFTSPPYGQQRDYTEDSDCGDWDSLMCGVFGNLPMADAGQVLVNLGLIHRNCEWVPYWDGWIEWMRAQGWRRFGWYVWDQGFGLPGNWNGRFAPCFEFVFHFNKETAEPIKWVRKLESNIGGRKQGQSTMRKADGKTYEFTNPEASAQSTKIPDAVIRETRMSGNHGVDHPAIFSIKFASHVLLSWADTVYDPFLGSGTTLIAAEQLNRRCYGVEISPAYCDVIVKRWENLTGKTAERINGH